MIDTNVAVVDTRMVVADTNTMVAHRSVLAGQEGKNNSVGTTVVRHQQNSNHRLGSSQVSDTEYFRVYNLMIR